MILFKGNRDPWGTHVSVKEETPHPQLLSPRGTWQHGREAQESPTGESQSAESSSHKDLIPPRLDTSCPRLAMWQPDGGKWRPEAGGQEKETQQPTANPIHNKEQTARNLQSIWTATSSRNR